MSENKSFITKAFDDMKEDAKEQHRIDKENFEVVKADSKERFNEATAPNPDMEEFVQAKGFKAKLNVLLEQAGRNAKKMREEDRAQYEETLKEMRDKMNGLNLDDY